MRLFTSLFLILLAFTSCEIENEFHFNKDLSGNVSSTIDIQSLDLLSSMGQNENGISMVDSLLGILDSSKEDEKFIQRKDSMQKVYRDLGLIDFDFSRSGESKINFSYKFNDLSIFAQNGVLEKQFSNSLGKDASPELDSESSFNLFSYQVEQENDWLIIDIAGKSMTKEEVEGFKEELQQMRASMNDPKYDNMSDEEFSRETLKSILGASIEIYKVKNKFTFDSNIKQIQSTLPYEQEGNNIILNYNANDLVIDLMLNGEVKLKVELE